MASKMIAETLRDDYDMDVDLSHFDLHDYHIDVYHDYFLGSQGKKVTLAKTAPEDISVLTPNFANSIHVTMPGGDVDADGGFSLLLDKKSIERKDYYGLKPYAVYCYADQPWIDITNHALSDFREQTVLVLKDSFGRVVVPFLAMGTKHVQVLDIRYFNGSVEKYIEEKKPDIVLVLYHAGVFIKENRTLWDFR